MIAQPRFLVRFVPLTLAIIAVAAICPGCSHWQSPVVGEVTFNGNPVEDGTISFESADGTGPTTGGQIVAGKYELIGAAAPIPGKKIVRINAIRKTGRKIRDNFSAAGALTDQLERYIPDIYNTRSTLSCEVTAQGPGQIDFHLKTP